MKVTRLFLVFLVIGLVFVPSVFALDVSVVIVSESGASDKIDIEDWTNQDSHWFYIRVENTTASEVKVNSIQIALSYEREFLSVVEVEKDNTAFSGSTFSSNVSNPTVDGELNIINITAADATGITLAASTGKATVAWLRLDPSQMHVDRKYDVKVAAEIYDGTATPKKTYKREATTVVYCDTLKGDNSFGGPTDPVTSYDVLIVAQQAAGAVDYIGDSILLKDIMDMDADGKIDAEDVYHTLKKAAYPAYVSPADETTHHPAPPNPGLTAGFVRRISGDPSATCVFRLTPLERMEENHYRVYLDVEGLPQKPIGVDVDFSKTSGLRINIEPTEFLSEAEKDSAVRETTARLVFAQLSPFNKNGRVAEIDIKSSGTELPEFYIKTVFINEGRPAKEGEERNWVRWEMQKILTPPTRLFQNYPNPFNPETWIPYQLSEPSEVNIAIFSLNGQMVRELRLGTMMPGFYLTRSRSAHWDGKNETGEQVASGVYFYSIQAGGQATTRKMLVIK